MKETVEEAKQRAANYMSLKGALEVKEETLEESIERLVKLNRQDAFIEGAKFQAERMYSEEDMIEFAVWLYLEVGSNSGKDRTNKELFKQWFEQFKKK